MNKTETATMLSTLADIWSNEVVTPGKVDIYHALLKDHAAEDVMAAAITHMASSEFFPKPAHLLRLLAERQTPETSIGEATQLIQRQINGKGYARYAEWTFDDPAVAEAVAAIGPQRICLEDRSKGDYVTRDLEVALKAAQERRRRGVQDGTAIGPSNVIALDRAAS